MSTLIQLSEARSCASSLVSGTMLRQLTGQTSTQASHSMQALAVKCVWMSQFRQRSTSRAACSGEKPSSTSVSSRRKRSTSSTWSMRVRPSGL